MSAWDWLLMWAMRSVAEALIGTVVFVVVFAALLAFVWVVNRRSRR